MSLSRKSDRRDYPVRRRLKSSIVHDPNGSMSTFKQFYQNGGRDYEEYRRWLQTLPKQSIENQNKTKDPIGNPSNCVDDSESTPEIVQIHSPLKLIRRSSFSTDSSPPFGSPIRSQYDYSPCLVIPSITHWSVHDVGQFIERNFPETNIARKFIEQKIDGRTLPLLTEDHLTRIFKLKLGPALQLLALISSLPK